MRSKTVIFRNLVFTRASGSAKPSFYLDNAFGQRNFLLNAFACLRLIWHRLLLGTRLVEWSAMKVSLDCDVQFPVSYSKYPRLQVHDKDLYNRNDFTVYAKWKKSGEFFFAGSLPLRPWMYRATNALGRVSRISAPFSSVGIASTETLPSKVSPIRPPR